MDFELIGDDVHSRDMYRKYPKKENWQVMKALAAPFQLVALFLIPTFIVFYPFYLALEAGLMIHYLVFLALMVTLVQGVRSYKKRKLRLKLQMKRSRSLMHIHQAKKESEEDRLNITRKSDFGVHTIAGFYQNGSY